MESPPPFVPPFHLGVLAPIGFRHPELGTAVKFATSRVLSRRLARRQPIDLLSIVGQPIGEATVDVARMRGWHVSMFAKVGDGRAVLAEIATLSNGIIVLHGGELDPVCAWVVNELCPWLRVPAGAFAVNQFLPSVTPKDIQ